MGIEFVWYSNGMGTYALRDADGNDYGSVSISVTVWTARVRGYDPERFFNRNDAMRWVEDRVSDKARR